MYCLWLRERSGSFHADEVYFHFKAKIKIVRGNIVVADELHFGNIPVEEREPELIVRVRCCHCGFEQNTSTLKMVKYVNCGHSFRVFTKWGCRIRKIVKGNQNLLTKMFYQTYKHRRIF